MLHFGTIEFQIGDVNCDGKVSAIDAYYILQHAIDTAEFNEQQVYLADVNDDESISSIDARKVLQIVADF